MYIKSMNTVDKTTHFDKCGEKSPLSNVKSQITTATEFPLKPLNLLTSPNRIAKQTSSSVVSVAIEYIKNKYEPIDLISPSLLNMTKIACSMSKFHYELSQCEYIDVNFRIFYSDMYYNLYDFLKEIILNSSKLISLEKAISREILFPDILYSKYLKEIHVEYDEHYHTYINYTDFIDLIEYESCYREIILVKNFIINIINIYKNQYNKLYEKNKQLVADTAQHELFSNKISKSKFKLKLADIAIAYYNYINIEQYVNEPTRLILVQSKKANKEVCKNTKLILYKEATSIKTINRNLAELIKKINTNIKRNVFNMFKKGLIKENVKNHIIENINIDPEIELINNSTIIINANANLQTIIQEIQAF